MATSTNTEPFQIKNMRNINWTNKDGSPSIVKASFTLVILPHKLELKDCFLKVGKNGPWVEGKSIPCTPWTDRNGREQTFTQVANLRTMDRKLQDQLNKHVNELYNTEGNYDQLNGTTATAANTATEQASTEAQTVAA